MKEMSTAGHQDPVTRVFRQTHTGFFRLKAASQARYDSSTEPMIAGTYAALARCADPCREIGSAPRVVGSSRPAQRRACIAPPPPN